MDTLTQVFDTIENKLKSGKKLCDLVPIVNSYSGNDWSDHVKINKSCYNRAVIKKNEFMEVVVITWNRKQASCKHGHPDGGCVYKVLQGRINEQFYKTMDSDEHVVHSYKQGDASYIHNSLGFHVMNNVHDDICVSLHIYSPPFEKCCD